jgi:hypothetical protein
VANRTLLRGQIAEAWRECIERDYAAQRINSERSLQASFWSCLNALLPAQSRRMFIEPGLTARTPATQTRYPDLVVCNTRQVIAIIELKYQPRARPSWHKDLQTFHWIPANRDALVVSNTRFRGVSADARSYRLSPDVLYVWAGVHAGADLDLRAQVPVEWRAAFLQLHAETRAGSAIALR